VEQSDPVVDGGEQFGVTVEVETAVDRGTRQFFLVAVLLVIEDVALDLQVAVVDVTELLDHFQHVQPYRTNHSLFTSDVINVREKIKTLENVF